MTTPLNCAKMSVSGTPGTGNVTLGSAISGFQSLSAAGAVNGLVYRVRFEDTGGAWEISLVTYSTTGPSLTSRVLIESSTGSLLSLTSAAVVGSIDDPMEAYYSGSSTNVVTNPAPVSLTQLVSVTVRAAAYARVFAVSGMITWNTSTHGMRGGILRDGTRVWPNLSSPANSEINPIASGDGAYTLTFSGIPVSVAGDAATHTLGLGWSAQASTASITLQEAWITAIKIA